MLQKKKEHMKMRGEGMVEKVEKRTGQAGKGQWEVDLTDTHYRHV